MFRNLFARRNPAQKSRGPRREPTARPCVECLEDRVVPSISGTFTVNQATNLHQYESATASARYFQPGGWPSQLSVVVWTHQWSATDTDIRARVYLQGVGPVSGEIWVASTGRNEHSPKVAMDDSGNFVVVWEDDWTSTDHDIRFARFTSTGQPRSSGIVAFTGMNEYDPDVATSSSGSFVVTYTVNQPGTGPDVMANMYNFSGGLVTSFAVANSGLAESHARVAYQAGGDYFAIAYQMQYPGSDTDVHLARYNYTGSAVTRLGDRAMDYSGRQDINPAVAMDVYGTAVVVYQTLDSGNWNVRAQRVSSSGVLGGEFLISASSLQEINPVVAMNALTGKVVVAYESRGDIEFPGSVRVREVSGSNAVGGEYNLGTGLWAPSICLNYYGNYMVTSTGFGPGSQGWDVFGSFGTYFI